MKSLQNMIKRNVELVEYDECPAVDLSGAAARTGKGKEEKNIKAVIMEVVRWR